MFTTKIDRPSKSSIVCFDAGCWIGNNVNLRNAGVTYKVKPVGQGRVKHRRSERETSWKKFSPPLTSYTGNQLQSFEINSVVNNAVTSL